jgi:hypothetical protein
MSVAAGISHAPATRMAPGGKSGATRVGRGRSSRSGLEINRIYGVLSIRRIVQSSFHVLIEKCACDVAIMRAKILVVKNSVVIKEDDTP